MSVWLQNLSWEEVGAKLKAGEDVVIIPVGSTEQHGRHLPLGTDTMVATFIAEDAAVAAGCLVAPPVWFGWSPHHMVLPGTITIRPEVLIELLYDVIDSLQQHGFRKFVVINGHRIVNIPWMQIAAERAQRLLGVKVALFDPAYMSKEIVSRLNFGTVGHAEEIETSHMMHKEPELVRLEMADNNPVYKTPLYSVDPSYAGDTLCYVPSTREHIRIQAEKAGGTGGEPSKSSAEKGKLYHKHLVENLVKVISSLQGKM
jgi:creatinine amidohydrolase